MRNVGLVNDMQENASIQLLRKLIREAISDNVRDRISGFVDEIVELSKQSLKGHKSSMKQLKWLSGEVESIIKFFERNNEDLARVAFERLQAVTNKVVKLIGFWNRPVVIGKKAYMAKLKSAVEDVLHEAENTRRLLWKVKRKTF